MTSLRSIGHYDILNDRASLSSDLPMRRFDFHFHVLRLFLLALIMAVTTGNGETKHAGGEECSAEAKCEEEVSLSAREQRASTALSRLVASVARLRMEPSAPPCPHFTLPDVPATLRTANHSNRRDNGLGRSLLI